MSAISLARNPKYHARSKHIDIRYHFVREALKQEAFSLSHVSSGEMATDILTKSLCKFQHLKYVKMLGLDYQLSM